MVQQTILNGIPVGELADSMNSIKCSPELGKFKFHAKNKWLGGAHCSTEINDFYAAGVQTYRQNRHVIEADEPVELLGHDHGANATEALLHALGACLNAAFIYHATDQGVYVYELEIDLEGMIDVNGFLGIDENVRNGYEHIDVVFRVKADADKDKITELCELAQKRSPVFDIVSHPVDVCVKLEC